MRRLAGPGAAALAGAILLTATACGSAFPSASASEGLAGSWAHTLDQAQLLAAHIDISQPQNLKLDLGLYRLVLSHGRAKLSKQNPISAFHTWGSYKIHGDTIAIQWAHAVEHDKGSLPAVYCVGGVGCDPPWRLRWSLYRGALSLREVPDGTFQVPAAMWVTPWRRAGG